MLKTRALIQDDIGTTFPTNEEGLIRAVAHRAYLTDQTDSVVFTDQTLSLRDDFRAAGDGVHDDTAALLQAANAATTGYHIDGGGHTYAINGDWLFTGKCWVQNTKLIQLDPDDQFRRTIKMISGDSITLKKVSVNRSGVTGREGSVLDAAGIWVAGIPGVDFDEVEVFGGSLGNGVLIVGAIGPMIRRINIHDLWYSCFGNPGIEQCNGIGFSRCENITVENPRVDYIYAVCTTIIRSTANNGAGKVRCVCDTTNYLVSLDRLVFSGATKTVGINGTHLIDVVDLVTFDLLDVNFVVAEDIGVSADGNAGTTASAVFNKVLQCDAVDYSGCNNGRMTGGKISRVVEGTDCSGSARNRNLWFENVTYEECEAIGLKFVHDMSNSGAVGCTAVRCGTAGFGVGSAATNVGHLGGATDIRYIGCNVVDVGFKTFSSRATGFTLGQPGAGGAYLQTNLELIGCIARDTSSIDLPILTTEQTVAGKTRCRVPTTSYMVTGQYVSISGATETGHLNGIHPITLVDGTAFDVDVAFVAPDKFAEIGHTRIISVRNNGTGKIRCELDVFTDTSTMFTGQLLYFANFVINRKANGWHPVTIVDLQHFDILDTPFTQAFDPLSGREIFEQPGLVVIATATEVLIKSTSANPDGKVRLNTQLVVTVASTSAGSDARSVLCTLAAGQDTAQMVSGQFFTFPAGLPGTPNMAGERRIVVVSSTTFECQNVGGGFVATDINFTAFGPTKTIYWSDGQRLYFKGAVNNPQINGVWPIKVVDERNIDLIDVPYTVGALTDGGIIATSIPTMDFGYRNESNDPSSMRLVMCDSFGDIGGATTGLDSGYINVDRSTGVTNVTGGMTVGGPTSLTTIQGTLRVDRLQAAGRNLVPIHVGLNSNIVTANFSNVTLALDYAGTPGLGPFALGGFIITGPIIDGTELHAEYFGVEQCVIIRNDTMTQLPFRIETMAAGNLVLSPGRFIATFYYSGSLAGFVVKGVTQASSGLYTPVIPAAGDPGLVNVGGAVASLCQWSKAGNMLQVSGKIVVNATAAGTVKLPFSLPIPTDLLFEEAVVGSSKLKSSAAGTGAVYGDIVNDRAIIEWVAGDNTSQTLFFNMMYRLTGMFAALGAVEGSDTANFHS